MTGKAMRIFLLLLLTAWYAAVLPGHTRGAMQLPGSACAKAAASKCCNHEKSNQPADAPAKPASNCAVCHYMAALSAPPPLGHGLAPLKPADVLRVAVVIRPTSARVILPYDGRAPPAA